ncbi:hypothetical protein PG994_002616 [Apiospora phragmitis]|uniref:Uncharacterized protein n=1 Tax=Apiospora phragmitis TaxID=2905665 RepID=A0ABR1W5P7_9PEZI
MVIDDDDSSGSGGDFHDGDADKIHHGGGNNSDSDDTDPASSSNEDPLPASRRRLTSVVFNVREFGRQDNFVENKTRMNLYKAIHDHIGFSEEIEKLTERMMDCKDPVKIERFGRRLHRLELHRRACRDAIENVLVAEDRMHAAEYAQAAALAAAANPGRYLQQQQQSGADVPETMAQWQARNDRERRQQVDRRVAEIRAKAEHTNHLNNFLAAAKQAAKIGAKRLRASLTQEAREKREWQGKKKKEEAEARKAVRARKRGGRAQTAYSSAPSEVGSMAGNASA